MTPSSTDRTDLLELADRVEKASGPDREIDRDTYFTVECEPIPTEGVKVVNHVVLPGMYGYYYTWRGAPTDGSLAPAYTSSLDAAMMLVPEGWVWSINTFAEPNKSASAYLMNGRNEMVRPTRQYIATPALALTAACLRAIANKTQEPVK